MVAASPRATIVGTTVHRAHCPSSLALWGPHGKSATPCGPDAGGRPGEGHLDPSMPSSDPHALIGWPGVCSGWAAGRWRRVDLRIRGNWDQAPGKYSDRGPKSGNLR